MSEPDNELATNVIRILWDNPYMNGLSAEYAASKVDYDVTAELTAEQKSELIHLRTVWLQRALLQTSLFINGLIE